MREAATIISPKEDGLPYDIVLSFAGEDRAYVEEVARYLKDASVSVFYDKYEQAKLWGKDLYEHLDVVYQHKGRYCVMFISEAYRDKVWTNHERRSAQARAFQKSEDYILPARFDDTEIPGVRRTLGYIDLRTTSPRELADIILTKLGDSPSTEPVEPSSSPYRHPRVGRRDFNPYDEALAFISKLIEELKRRCDALGSTGVSASVFDREGRKCLRVVLGGSSAYSLDVWMGGFGGDSTIHFYGGRGEMRGSSGSMNAWGDFVWNREREMAVLDFQDLSLLSHMPGKQEFTAEEFIDALWERICDAIEEAD